MTGLPASVFYREAEKRNEKGEETGQICLSIFLDFQREQLQSQRHVQDGAKRACGKILHFHKSRSMPHL